MRYELNPVLTEGKIVAVNDTAIKVDIQGRLGVITVPRRWVLTDAQLRPGLKVEFYFSYMQVACGDETPGASDFLIEQDNGGKP